MFRRPETHVMGFGIVLIGATLFGMLGVLSRWSYDAGMEPLAFVAWRAWLGAIGMAALVAWSVRRGRALASPRRIGRRASVSLAIAAFAGFTVNLGMFYAFDRISVALTLLCFYTYPAMVAVVATLLGRERLGRMRVAALTLAIGGMVGVVAGGLDPAGGIRLDLIGIGLAFGAAVGQTVFATISRDGFLAVPTEQAMLTVMVVMAVLCVGLALVTGAGPTLTFPIGRPGLIGLLAFTGIFAAAIPSTLFLGGIRLIGPTMAGIVMLLEPVVGVALAALLLNQGLHPIQVAGGAAILLAAVLVQRTAGGEPTKHGVEAAGSAGPTEEDVFVIRVPGGP